MKGLWAATDSLVNRKQTYYFVIGLAMVFSLAAVTLGALGKRNRSEFTTPAATLLTIGPSFRPSLPPSLRPSLQPTALFSEAPSQNSTELDFNFTLFPTNGSASSLVPTVMGSLSPSLLPSPAPEDTDAPTGEDIPSLDSVTRFYAIGDVPYTQRETTELITQIEELEDDAEFLIHVGDIRNARNKTECTIQQYYEVADILNKSHAPVFIVLGGESNGGDRRNNESRVFIPYLRNPIASTFYFQTTSGMIVST